jgi:N6-adenosine-specific RNA methylase IME4
MHKVQFWRTGDLVPEMYRTRKVAHDSNIEPAPAPFTSVRRRHYGAIAVDPPSRFKSYAPAERQPWHSRRDAERHYATMSFEELAALPVKDLASPAGCHLFLWTSGPFLPQALALIAAWGFKYSTRAFTWLKVRRDWDGHASLVESDFPAGTGHTTRAQSEMVLLARRGGCRRQTKNVNELIFASRREHSRKPGAFFTHVERYCSGPYCELFARERRIGWDCFGNEVDKFGSGS